MAIINVTDPQTNKKVSVDTNRVSRIIDQGSYRELLLGTGNVSNPQVRAKETISALQQTIGAPFGLVVDSITKRTALVNPTLISYIYEFVNLCEIWFGPNAEPDNSTTSLLSVSDKITVLSQLQGLALLTNVQNGKKIAVNPSAAYGYENAGSTRTIYFASPRSASPGVISVKETAKQLESLGIASI